MYAQYRQLRRRRGYAPLRRWRLFRTARLNAVGWAALTGWVVAWGSIVGEAARLVDLWPAAGALLGAAAGLVVVVIFDRRRWSGMEAHFGWTDEPAVVQQAVQRLLDAGVAVSYYMSPDGEPHLVYRQRDERRVMRLLGFPAWP